MYLAYTYNYLKRGKFDWSFSRQLFLQKIPSNIFDRILNTSLGKIVKFLICIYVLNFFSKKNV